MEGIAEAENSIAVRFELHYGCPGKQGRKLLEETRQNEDQN
jgi:hypothetical protein